MNHNYEVEIKVLLGSEENKNAFKKNLEETVEKLEAGAQTSQLNHYFIGGDFAKLQKALEGKISPERVDSFTNITSLSGKHSVRTRYVDGWTILVIKLSVDDTTSSNGIQRLEWEEVFPEDHIDEVDALLLKCDFAYQAKWSREREEYRTDNITVCIDKNAGYGYLAEFEMVVDSAEKSQMAESNLRGMIARLGLQELDQDRLARMFAHYNENWRDYYGTDKTFDIK